MADNRKRWKRWGWWASGLLLLTLSNADAQSVVFRIRAHGARQAVVCGSFAHWRCLPLHRDARGVFCRRIVVPPGLYEYGFKVDGHWRVARREAHVPDGFGGVNNLLMVGP